MPIQPEMVDVTTITTHRPPRPLTPATGALLESVRDAGIVMPLVVDGHYDLVSGGRRLAAARALGIPKVPVYRAADLATACALISAERAHGVAAVEMTFDQQWALVARLEELKVPGGGATAAPVSKAAGHSSSWLDAARRVERIAGKPGPHQAVARGLWNRVRAGSLSPYSADRILREQATGRRPAHRLRDPAQQEDTLTRIAGQVAGIADVADLITTIIIDPDQAAVLAGQIAGATTRLTRLTRRLKERSSHE